MVLRRSPSVYDRRRSLTEYQSELSRLSYGIGGWSGMLLQVENGFNP